MPNIPSEQTWGLPKGSDQFVEAFARDLAVGMVCRQHMFDNGVIMRAVGDRMIVAPPLVMTCTQIDEMAARIRDCLDLTLADVAGRGWLD